MHFTTPWIKKTVVYFLGRFCPEGCGTNPAVAKYFMVIYKFEKMQCGSEDHARIIPKESKIQRVAIIIL
jgi:hypothetical protein